MKRRGFLASLGMVAAVPALARVPLSHSTERVQPSVWLTEILDLNIDPQSVLTHQKIPVRIVDLAGGVLFLMAMDRMLAALSGNTSIDLFPRQPWKGCRILSQPFHLSSYMAMRYALTADKDNAELDRAHEGAVWTIDHRIRKEVVLFEAANGNLGLMCHVANWGI